jgi:hypothetical protein
MTRCVTPFATESLIARARTRISPKTRARFDASGAITGRSALTRCAAIRSGWRRCDSLGGRLVFVHPVANECEAGFAHPLRALN